MDCLVLPYQKFHPVQNKIKLDYINCITNVGMAWLPEMLMIRSYTTLLLMPIILKKNLILTLNALVDDLILTYLH